jgi:hypothetical protein
VTGVLQRFNAYNENAHPDGIDKGQLAKVAILNKWLEENTDLHGNFFPTIPRYDIGIIGNRTQTVKDQAGDNRRDFIGGQNIPGIINEPAP